jgi:hypothetical protein
MSGVAATLLHGETTHMAIGINRRKIPQSMIDEWEDTRLVFIDECSFASAGEICKINGNCQTFKLAPFKPAGGINLVYTGDFSQLEPPRCVPIYNNNRCPEFHDTLNAFIELDGMHRFRDDHTWGERLLLFQNGAPTFWKTFELSTRIVWFLIHMFHLTMYKWLVIRTETKTQSTVQRLKIIVI